MWPFRRRPAIAPKSEAPPSAKGAAFFFATGAGRAGLSGAGYDLLSGEGYAECVIAFDCINRIASAVASVEPQLYRKNGGKLDRVEDHPLLDLFQNPNAAQSGKEFLRHLVSYHRLSGNAYVLGNGLDPLVRKSKPPSEMQLLNPGKVKVAAGESYLPKGYEYKPSPSQAFFYPVDQVSGRSAVMHLKTFHPLNPWYGLSPLTAAALGVDIHNDGQKWNKRLIENGARPSGALVVTGGDGKSGVLSEDQFIRVKEMIDEQFSGPNNAGRPMLLEGGLDWKEMSINPKDMEFLQGKHAAARDIALAFEVPPQLLGIPGDNTYSNYSEAKLAFWTDTVLPLAGMIYDGFNRWLTPLYGDDLILWYDEDAIPALEPLRKQKADRINAAAFMTFNEKRRAMGLDDVEGGDMIFVPAANIPLGLAGTLNSGGSPSVYADQTQQAEAAPTPDPAKAARHRKWLISQGYTPERAERLAKLVCGG